MAVVASLMEQLSLDGAAAAGDNDTDATPEALSNTACLAATFSWLDDEASLVTAAAVCQLWASVLESDAIWGRVYLRCLPPPAPHERVGRCARACARCLPACKKAPRCMLAHRLVVGSVC